MAFINAAIIANIVLLSIDKYPQDK